MLRRNGAMTDEAPKVVPFGKFKGRLIEEVLDDPQFLSWTQWALNQPGICERYASFCQIVINRGAAPEETPDHNAMQVKFLDDDFCVQFLACINPSYRAEALQALEKYRACDAVLISKTIAYNSNELSRARSRLEEAKAWEKPDSWLVKCYTEEQETAQRHIDHLLQIKLQFQKSVSRLLFKISTREFEHSGIDVVLKIDARSADHDPYPEMPTTLRWPSGVDWWSTILHEFPVLSIELKPVIGDDYPAVLRQMKRTDSTVLFVGEYRGQGATEEQFVKTMASAGIRVVFARDVEN
jgi:hypothetical protein